MPFLFKDTDHCYEGGLRQEDGSTNKGAFGRAVLTSLTPSMA